MNHGARRNTAASVRQRLLNRARTDGADFQRVLMRFGAERLLYRLSQSEHRDTFILKGALLFAVWLAESHRSTKDLDLLGGGDPAVGSLIDIFRSLCAVPVEPDGLTFLPESVSGAEIREEQEYGGIRITLRALLGSAHIPLQVDIGFGDAVTPAPDKIQFPTLLDLPAPRLRVYPRETVVAEKLQAMISLGLDNSRMKDFFDLWTLARHFSFDGMTLAAAIAATFQRRRTPLPAGTPVALTETFSGDSSKNAQWRAFVKRSLTTPDAPSLPEVVSLVGQFLLPVLEASREGHHVTMIWVPGGPWSRGRAHQGLGRPAPGARSRRSSG